MKTRYVLSPPSRSGRRLDRRAAKPAAEALEGRELLAAGDVLTYHNDNARTGQNLTEAVLRPSTVNVFSFAKMFSQPVDGAVYAQPLYAANVRVNGAVHNVVYVATAHDSVYAFDADTNLGPNAAPLWKTSFLLPSLGVTTVPGADVNFPGITELGVIGTPVIDRASGTIFVAGMIKLTLPSGPQYFWQLHALDMATGAEKLGVPVNIRATVPGAGGGGTSVNFDATHELQRTGLLLSNGVVYVGFASFSDTAPFYGWTLGYDARTLKLVSAFNAAPNGQGGGIWMSGGGPAADAAGNIYLATGNGGYSASTGGNDYGDSVVKFAPGGGLKVVGSYTPPDQSDLTAEDADLGSAGVLLLPDQPGKYPHQLVTGTKDGRLMVLNRDSLGGLNPGPDSLLASAPPHSVGSQHPTDEEWLGLFSTPAYFNNRVYLAGVGDRLKAFPVVNGRVSLTPSAQSPNTFNYPGGTPSVSANGNANGIVWVLEKGNPAVLHAYDAADVSRELYNSNMVGTRDHPAGSGGVTFATPTVANGKVFVGTNGALTVYGDLMAGYVNGRSRLIAQGLSAPAIDYLLATSPDFVWHPSLAIKPILDPFAAWLAAR